MFSRNVYKKSYNNVKHMEQLLDLYLDHVNNLNKTIYDDKNIQNSEFDSFSELEMEIKFGTGKNMKRITKLDHDNVIKRILSAGFKHSSEETILRIFGINGSFSNNNIRIEINGIGNISQYCKTNSLINNDKHIAKIIEKKYFNVGNVSPLVEFQDFNFNSSLKIEVDHNINNPYSILNEVTSKFNKIKKYFRYINRHTFIHPDFPLKIDISVVKESKRTPTGSVQAVYDFNEADLLNSPDRYEIEIELLNNKLIKSNNTLYDSGNKLYSVIKKAITFVLSGIQKTNYPVSNSEQKNIINEYINIVFNKNQDADNNKIIPKARNFIGPSSYTLQIENISIDIDQNIPNIRNNYTVTDKADGERKLLFINNSGRLYFIDTNMNVQFTGTVIDKSDLFNTLIDGELITHNKNKEFINLFMAFDIYFISKKDVRMHKFKNTQKNDIIVNTDSTYRLDLLQSIVSTIKNNITSVSSFKNNERINTLPLRIDIKHFETSDSNTSIFECCKSILYNNKKGLFEYEIDGLIFTPANFPVGHNSENEKYKPEFYKQTWNSSFKWKPSDFNTIDFLVSTNKENGIEKVNTSFTSGHDMTPIIEYKTVTLRVGFDEKKHGFLNPCQDIINDVVYDNKNNEEDKDKGYKPVQFFPSNPSDPNAGICNIILKEDSSGEKQMFSESGEIIEDRMIVEFKYDINRPNGWKWIPIRVRYDKTADLRANGRNFGNAYHVANSNWHSIHYPITENMISTGKNNDGTDIFNSNIVDDDIYYKRDKDYNETKCLRDFHNKYVKKMLIQNVSKPDNTLIDLAVGKAGDLHKWISSELKFVLGIDISKDNITNRIDGACARYLSTSKKMMHNTSALFINGDSSKNLKNGDGLFNDDDKIILNSLNGNSINDAKKIGKGVYKNFGVAKDGFDICSIQFAIHYMFENMQKLTNFLTNVSDNTKIGGYFIATCYDGRTIFNKLNNKKNGESETYVKNNKKVWSITKKYDFSEYLDDESCLGYAIDVYQESINKTFREYLVNYNYLNRILNNYGFTQITIEEAKKINFPNGSDMFNFLHTQMINQTKNDPELRTKYGDAFNMSDIEKKISFLNRFFIYKKSFNVDTSNISSILLKNNIQKTENIIKPLKKKLRIVSKLSDVENNSQPLQLSQPLQPLKKKLRIVK